jgi:cysteine synthase A
MNYAKSITDLVGRTPILLLDKYSKKNGVDATLFAKLESFNPGGSVKDRIAKFMIELAERDGTLIEGSVLVEPTSGNTGIGLAAIAASKGYRIILTMPDSMSMERRNLLKAYGAEIVLTEGSQGMSGAIRRAEELVKEIPGAVMPSQFDNPANPLAHWETTAREIDQDLEGAIDVFVAGIGTGGTITGVGRYMKEHWPKTVIIGVEPAESAVLSGGEPGPHLIQGIGAGFAPKVLDLTVIDEIVQVEGEDALSAARDLARTEGVLCGISSGAVLVAAADLAKRDEYKGKNIVVLLPDTGERYLSTKLIQS